ncbi:MAG: Ig-like domain-containing protein [Clostridiales bacterium]|nr:Ig-like domain-containing protein [Candidatus Crickella equi]
MKKILIIILSLVLTFSVGIQSVNANAVDKLTIKIGYFGWPTSDYVEKKVFKASDLYNMGTIKRDYTYWDGGKRVAIDSSIGVQLTDIIDAAGIDQSSIAQMDFWTADSGNGAFTSFTWQQLLGTKRYYFKNLAACFEYADEKDKDDKSDDKSDEKKDDSGKQEEQPKQDDQDNQDEDGQDIEVEVSGLDLDMAPTGASSTNGRKVVINKDKAWKNAKRVPAMMALEENWTWYEIGTSNASGTDNLGTSNRFRLNFGQAKPDEKRTFNSAKQVHTIYIMFSGTPKLTSKETNINAKVGSSHQLKVSAAAADAALEKKIEKSITWSTSDESIVSVDSNGNLQFNKDGTAKVYAKSNGAVKEFTVTVGDQQGGGEGNGEGSGTGGKGNPDKDKGANTKKELVKIDAKSNSFILSDAASQRLKLALNRQADADEASMNTHQEEMDNDAEQLKVKKDINSMAFALFGINGALAAAGAAFGVYRYKRQRWGKLNGNNNEHI